MEKELKKIDELLEKGVITNDEYQLLRNKTIDNIISSSEPEEA